MPNQNDEVDDWDRDPSAFDQRETMEVGYKRPPPSGTFKKGNSGNPSGRPKGRRSLPALLKRLLNASVTVRSGEITRRMTKAEAMLRIQVGKARQGDERALDTIIAILNLAGHFDELSDEERNKYGVVEVPPKLPQDEWELLFGPDFEDQRQKYLAMPDLVDPNYVPTPTDLKYQAWETRTKAGDEFLKNSDLAGAQTSYQEALKIIRELSEAEPDEPQWWHVAAHALHRVGYVLYIQNNPTGTIPFVREALEPVRKVGPTFPNVHQAKVDTAFFLRFLASLGDDPVGRLNEALEILKTLDNRGRLTSEQRNWLSEIKQNLATLGAPGANQSAKPRAKVTRPVVLRTDLSRRDGANDQAVGIQSQNSTPDTVVVPEARKSYEQWKKSIPRAAARKDEPTTVEKKPRPQPVYRTVDYNRPD